MAVVDVCMLDDWSAELLPQDGDEHLQRAPDDTHLMHKSDDVGITEELTEELCCEALAQLDEEHAALRSYVCSLLAFWDTRSDRAADLDCVLAQGVNPFATSHPEVDALVFWTRVNNLRRAVPHLLDLCPEMLQRWEAWASERPRVSGVAPRGHPFPWLFVWPWTRTEPRFVVFLEQFCTAIGAPRDGAAFAMPLHTYTPLFDYALQLWRMLRTNEVRVVEVSVYEGRNDGRYSVRITDVGGGQRHVRVVFCDVKGGLSMDPIMRSMDPTMDPTMDASDPPRDARAAPLASADEHVRRRRSTLLCVLRYDGTVGPEPIVVSEFEVSAATRTLAHAEPRMSVQCDLDGVSDASIEI